MRTKAFYIGLTLIIISLVLCSVSFYLLVFGIPVFLVGTILIYCSKQTIKVKLFTTLTPLVLYFPLAFLFLYIYNYSMPKEILIPKNFEGNLRVVYEEKCGSNYGEFYGIKTLIFPKNGILILNESFDSYVNFKYYLIDELGNKTEITEKNDVSDYSLNSPFIVVGKSGTISQTIEANVEISEEKSIIFSDFYLFNRGAIYKEDYKSQQVFDSLTRDCKKL